MLNDSGLKRAGIALTVILVVLLAGATSAIGGTIKGTVSDQGNGEGLLGATVSVVLQDENRTLKSKATDDDGYFEITDVPEGTYTVYITFVGFNTQSFEITISPDDAAETQDISLEPSLLNFGSVSVTASRTPEKVVDAPASVSVIGSEEIGQRATLTPTEHIKGLPAVDVASTGLNQSNAVVRGFNNIFSGTLLVLADDRIARVPSLRFNAYNFISTSNLDIDRIEIVSGPGSALYGPNTASGVMHIITKSPFESQGTTVSFGGGERSLGIGAFRHAGNYQNRIGYKISGQYYQGNDWESFESTEPARIQLVKLTTAGEETVGDTISNERDFDVEKLSGDARVDFILNANTTLKFSGGFNRSSSIELTGLGAGQAKDWTYSYYQARLKYKDLFVQGFVNLSDAGDTYLRETGRLIVDKSRLWVGQIQHRFSPGPHLSLTYGLDALFTRPNTESTINGRNENDDDIDEVGAYVQSDLELNDKFKLVTAARLDDNSRLEDIVFSPRAALVYEPVTNHNFRVTYNKAYSTPDNNNLFLDLLQKPDVFGIGEKFSAVLPFPVDIDLRVQGVPESGFHWRMGDEGPSFRSVFAPLDPRGITSSDYIAFNDPIFTNVMWNTGSGVVLSGLPDYLSSVGVQDVNAMMAAIVSVTPGTVSPAVKNSLKTLDPDIGDFVASSIGDIADIDRLEPTITKTFELGYKGTLGDRLSFSIDAYRTDKDNFIGPLTVETPNVFLDATTLMPELITQFQANYGAADPVTQAWLDGLDANGNGPADELAGIFTSGSTQVPFGTASPEEAMNPDAVLVTYRNFGDISFYGTDLAFAYHLTRNWNVGGSYSYVSKNFFGKSADQVHDINLNAPRHKFSVNLHYVNTEHRLTAQGRLRFVDAFDMDSPFLGSTVQSYRVVDLALGVGLFEGTNLSVTVQNALDEEHLEFVGGPEIGRLTIARLTQSF